jgi:sugar phosphate permease
MGAASLIRSVELQRGENQMREIIFVSNLSCAVICAKWALDLGFSQIRQVLFLIGGLLFGPIMLLILYIFLVIKAKKEGVAGGKVF